MNIAAELYCDRSGERRIAERRPLEFRAEFRKRGYEAAKADILDISTTGFKVDTSMALGPDMEVWLKLPGLEPKPAVVMWVDGFHAGCRFLTPFYDAVLEQFLARVRPAA